LDQVLIINTMNIIGFLELTKWCTRQTKWCKKVYIARTLAVECMSHMMHWYYIFIAIV